MKPHRLWFPALLVLLSVLAGHASAQDAAPDRFWGSAEYLLWWTRSMPIPPLVTTGPIVRGTPDERPGVLGEPGTQVLMGGSVGFGPSSGGRFIVGGWVGEGEQVGIEGSYLFLAERSGGRLLSEPGTPGSRPLSLPFQDATLNNAESTTGIAVPLGTGFSGTADLNVTTRLEGWEATGVFRLAGYRYLGLHEGFTFRTVSTNVPPLVPDLFVTTDEFSTRNDFHGGQLGVRGELDQGAWFVRGTAKVALGNVRQVTRIAGELVTNDFTGFVGPGQRFAGGYFALPTNIGRYERDRFAVVPEIGVTLGWRPAEWLGVTVGYNFLYISTVTRPADQIDRSINPSQGPGFTGVPDQTLIGPAAPRFPGRDDEFWTHGLSFGVEVRF
jgi:hypothetical protein